MCLVSNNWHERVSHGRRRARVRAGRQGGQAAAVRVPARAAARWARRARRLPSSATRCSPMCWAGSCSACATVMVLPLSAERPAAHAAAAATRARLAGGSPAAAVDSQLADDRARRARSRMARINGTTQLAGVIGWPLDHSLSPAMHNAVYEELGLDWVYVPLAVADEVGLRRLVAAIRSLPFVGLQRHHAVQGGDARAVRRGRDGRPDGRRRQHRPLRRRPAHRLQHRRPRAARVARRATPASIPAGKSVVILGAGGAAGGGARRVDPRPSGARHRGQPRRRRVPRSSSTA